MMNLELCKLSLTNWKLSIGRLRVSFETSIMLAMILFLTLVVILGSFLLLLKNQKQSNLLIQSLQKENQRLTNLLTSKDPMTFSTLQTLTNGDSSPVAEVPIAGDDISVANELAKRYEAAGIDPAMAFDNPDDALGELGLKNDLF